MSLEVKAQLTAANLDGKLQDSAKAITHRVAIGDQERGRRSKCPDLHGDPDAVTLLQGQLASAVASGVKETKEFATAQVGGLRTELNNVIDSKLRATRDAVTSDFNSRLQVSHDELSSDLQARLNSSTKASPRRSAGRSR